jgi:uncharacterized membrane protein YozB (DUF420 family)
MTVTERVGQSATTSPLAGRGVAAKTARAGGAAHEAARTISRRRQTAHFVRHFLEMCAPMCIGFVVGDLVYFWAAEQQGYTEPFRQLPELSVLVVTLTMTAPMTAWMLFRGMSRRATAEMSAVMPALAIVLLALGWLAIVPKGDLALLEHGLMMPAMLVPMFVRLDLYTRRTGHSGHHRPGER